MTRAKALLLSLAVFVLGGAGYWGFSAAGFEEFDAGIAASVVLLLVMEIRVFLFHYLLTEIVW